MTQYVCDCGGRFPTVDQVHACQSQGHDDERWRQAQEALDATPAGQRDAGYYSARAELDQALQQRGRAFADKMRDSRLLEVPGLVAELLDVLRDAGSCIAEELDAAGCDEVAIHPTLRRHEAVLRRVEHVLEKTREVRNAD